MTHGRIATEARFASIFDAAKPLCNFSPRGIQLADGDRQLIRPALFDLGTVHAVPWDWAFLTGDGRLILDGTAINPLLVRRGVVPHIRPLPDDRCRIDLEIGAEVEEPCLFIGGDLFGNYYHWILDFLPRLRVAAHRLAHLADAPRIAVTADRPAFADDLIRLAGVDPRRVLPIPPDRATRFRRAFVISNFTQYGILQPQGLNLVRSLLPPPPEPGSALLYVTRRDARYRRVLNEPEVEAELARLGFRTVVPSDLTLQEQMALFSGARLVVGPHGAGLTNLVWTPAGCALLETKPHATALQQFERLAAALGRPYVALTAEPRDTASPGGHNSDYRVDVGRLSEAIAALLR